MTTFRRTQRTTKLPLPDVIADAVAEAIAMNRLQPGDRVVETALADELGASRVPTREALKVLHTQGILSGGRRGYRVSVFDAAVVSQILELRLVLETILLRDAVANWRRGQACTAELHAVIGRMEAAARRGDIKASLRGDLDFHRAIGRASGNSIAVILWEAIARHVLIIFSRPEYRDEDISAVPQQHRDLLRFIEDWITTPASDREIRRVLEEHLLLVPRRRLV